MECLKLQVTAAVATEEENWDSSPSEDGAKPVYCDTQKSAGNSDLIQFHFDKSGDRRILSADQYDQQEYVSDNEDYDGHIYTKNGKSFHAWHFYYFFLNVIL